MYKLTLVILIISSFVLGCTVDRTITELSETENSILTNFQKLNSKSMLKIVDDNEPGEKLKLCLTFVNKGSKKELINQLVKFYHTTTNGDYEETDAGDESTARLSGQSITNEKGQIYIETILPGDYGSSGDNRHIHTTVVRAKPRAYDIHFKQYIGYMLDNFVEGSEQHFLADLKRSKDGELVCFLTIEVKNPN